jgi:RHS repeat-associated protein
MSDVSSSRLVSVLAVMGVLAGTLAVAPPPAAADPVLSATSVVAAAPADAARPTSAVVASALTALVAQGRWLATSATSAMASVTPTQELIVAPELPVRFVPGTTVTTPVTVTNTTTQTLPASLQVSYRWTEVGSAQEVPGQGNRQYVPLGQDLPPGAAVTVPLPVRTPIQSDSGAKRLDHDLYVDLWDGSAWWSATHQYGTTDARPTQLCGLVAGKGLLCPDRLVEDPTSNQLGLEDFLSYAGEDTGSGTTLASNLSSGNAVWSYAPFENPGIGPSTFVRLSYNSMDVSDPGTGYGWSVQASTLTRLGSVLSVPKGGATAKTMTFVDGDGTTHVYRDGAQSGALTTYRRPGGVHLDLVRDESRPVESQWVFTRPDGVRFFYSQATGLPTSVVDTHANSLMFTHDADGQLTRIADSRNRTTLTLGWTAKRVSWMRELSGRGIRLTYNSTGQLVGIQDGGGFDPATGAFSGPVKTFGFAYTTEPVNKNAKLTTVTDPRGNATAVTYYSATEQPQRTWWVNRLTDRRGNETTFAYADPDGSAGLDVVADVTDANGTTPSVTTYRVDGFGRTTSIRDANVNAAAPEHATKVTHLLWDGDHNVIKMTAPNGTISTWDFDDATGYPLEQRDAEAVANATPPTTMTYRRLDGVPGGPTVVSSITTPPGQDAPLGRTTRFGYDEATGDLLSVTDPLGHVTRYTYNADGTLLTETDARGHGTTYPTTYHPAGLPETVTDALGNRTLVAYDERGNVVKVTDAAGAVTSATYDAFGRPTTETAPHDGGVTRRTTTEYDLNDNVTKVVDPTGAVTSSTYTPMDLPATDTLPANSAPATSRVATYTYDALDRVASMTSPAGRLTTYGYDRLGQVLSETTPFTDLDGQQKAPTTRYSYDWAGNLVKVENPNKTATADPGDHTTVLGYDDNNREIAVTDAAGNVTTTVYDADGTVARTVDAVGVETTYDYDLDERLTAVTVTHGEQPRVTRYSYDEVDNQTRVTRPSGLFSEVVYDELDRPIETRSPFGPAGSRYDKPARTFLEYDAVGRVKRQSDPTWATAGQDWTRFEYYSSGDVRTSTDPWGLTTAYSYNQNGQQTHRSVRGSGQSPWDRIMGWSYHPDGSLASQSNEDVFDEIVPTIHDDEFSVSDGGAYVDGGDTVTSTPTWDYEYRRYRGGAVFTWNVNLPWGGTYAVWTPCGQGAEGSDNPYFYEAVGATVSNRAAPETFCQGTAWSRVFDVTIDSARRVKIVVDGGEESATVSRISLQPTNVVPGYRTHSFGYDKDGVPTLTKSQEHAGPDKRWVSTPDGLGRIHRVEEIHGAETTARRTTDYRFDPAGNLLTVLADGRGTADNQATSRFTRYAYDTRELVSRVESGSNAVDPALKVTTYAYDAAGRRTTTTKGNGNVVTRTYYEDGRTKSVVERDGTTLVASHDLTYTADGDRRTDASKVANGDADGALLEQVATYAYTPARQLESVTKTGPNAGRNESYQYDAAGNTTCQTIGSDTTRLIHRRNRLVETWPKVAGCAEPAGATVLSHRYDSWGRAAFVAAKGVPVREYSYDGFDRLTRDESFLISTWGTQMGNDVTRTSTYDVFDRTVSTTTTVRAQAPRTTRYVHLGTSDQVANEEQKNASGAWSVTKAYSYGPGGEHLSMVETPLAGTTPAQTYFYGTNPHGDVETLTSSVGEVKATYRYQAYGQLDTTGTTGLDKVMSDPVQDAEVVNPYRFNGNRVDPATGQYDMGFRDYDPGLSRFLTRDSYNGALDDLALGLDPWTTNRYAFAGGNPVSFSELDGHRPIEENGDEVKNPEPYFPDSSSSGSSSSSTSSSSGSSSSGSSSSRIGFGGGMSGGAALSLGGVLDLGNLLSMTCRLCSPGSGIPPSLLFRGPGAGPSSYYYRGGTYGSSGLASSAVRGAITTPRGFGSTRFGATQQSRNQIFGNVARDKIASRYAGSRIERFRQTDFGGRRIDVLTPWRKAVESKVGRVSLNAFTRQQIRKDAWLLNSPRSGIDYVEWSFTRSSVTGRMGPTPALLRELRKVGIMVSYN